MPDRSRKKIGWLVAAGLVIDAIEMTYPGRKAAPEDTLHLALQPVLDADFLHYIQLGFQPINMLFSIFQYVFEKLPRRVILSGFTRSNSAYQRFTRRYFELEITFHALFRSFTN